MYIYGFNRNSTPSEYHPIFQLSTVSNASTVKWKNFHNTTLSFEMKTTTNISSNSSGSSSIDIGASSDGSVKKCINHLWTILIGICILYENIFYL